MKQTHFKLFLFMVLSFLFFSCKEEYSLSKDLLVQAQQIVESEPDKALVLLDSIVVPENMDIESYMQYTVTRVQAKYLNYEDIFGDTIINQAQQYFEKKNNSQYTALSHYYAGRVYRERKMQNEALVCFSKAIEYSEESNNNILSAKSYHTLGNIYFDKSLMDSAISHLKHALVLYTKEQNTDINKLRVINTIGSVYEEVNNLDSAYTYYDKGLELAKQIENLRYQTIFTHQLGIVFREKGEIDKGEIYLKEALANTTDSTESTRIYLNLAILYNNTYQLDSAKIYNDILKARLPEITYVYTKSLAYQTLSSYNELSGSFKTALYYTNLQKEEDKEISKLENAKGLLNKEFQHQMALREKEFSQQQVRLYFSIGIGILLFLIVLVFIYHKFKQAKEKANLLNTQNTLLETENNLLETENELLSQKMNQLDFLNSIYHNIGNKWECIDNKIKDLAKEYKATEEPSLITEIRSIVDEIRKISNIQLIDSAKSYLQQVPNGEKALAIFSDQELLLFMLRQNKCSNRTIYSLLGGDSPVRKYFTQSTYYLCGRLEEAGMDNQQIKGLLFPDEDDEMESL